MVQLYMRLSPKNKASHGAKVDFVICELYDEYCLAEAEVLIKACKPIHASLGGTQNDSIVWLL